MKTSFCILIFIMFSLVNVYPQLTDQTFSIVNTNSNVRHDPNAEAQIIGKVSKGDTVEIFAFKTNFYLIKKGSMYGYVFEKNIEKTPAVNAFVADYLAREKRREEERTKNIERIKQEVRSKLDPDNVKLYGEEIAERIYNHEIWIGMTPEMARRSLQASPSKINTSSYGPDQYVFDPPKFGYKYLYFNPKENALVSWQGEKQN